MSGDEPLRAALEAIVARREALTTVIESLEAVLDGSTPMTVTPHVPRRRVPRGSKRKPPTRRHRQGGKVDRSVRPEIAARDEAILQYFRRHQFAKRDELLAAMPKEPGQTEEQRDAAFRNALTRLKVKGQIDRTGDTWSRVGVGTDA